MVNHGYVTARHVISRRGRSKNVLGVKVEAIDDSIAPRSRDSPSRCRDGTEGRPEKLGELLAASVAFDIVVIWIATSNGQEDLLPVGLLARDDIRTNIWTGFQKIRGHTGCVVVGVAPAG